jgi:5'-3' exonuclease
MKGLSYEEKKVGIIFGFIKQIFKLAEQFNCKDFIFCWDSRQSYRKLIYPEYKSNRHRDLSDEDQVDLQDAYLQFDELREKVLPYMGFNNSFRQNGYEGDDICAFIVYRIPDDTIIVSNDNDLFQLLRDDRFCPVKIWNFKSLNTEQFFKKGWYGLNPSDWIKVKAIGGCTSDNVKGVPGVKAITASKYVAGVLSKTTQAYAAIESKEMKERAHFNHSLVALPFAGRKKINIELVEDEITFDKFKNTFGQYGFRSLLGEDQVRKWTNLFFGGVST